ncbi:MAG: hypothetical protein V5A84_01770, partial [Planctomycetota bacterium]
STPSYSYNDPPGGTPPQEKAGARIVYYLTEEGQLVRWADARDSALEAPLLQNPAGDLSLFPDLSALPTPPAPASRYRSRIISFGTVALDNDGDGNVDEDPLGNANNVDDADDDDDGQVDEDPPELSFEYIYRNGEEPQVGWNSVRQNGYAGWGSDAASEEYARQYRRLPDAVRVTITVIDDQEELEDNPLVLSRTIPVGTRAPAQ